jgi:hypothetical protein
VDDHVKDFEDEKYHDETDEYLFHGSSCGLCDAKKRFASVRR